MSNFYAPRDFEYGDIARNMVGGNGFSRTLTAETLPVPTSSHAPLYPFFLAFFYQFGSKLGSYLLIQIVQAIISIFTILLIFKTAKTIFNESSARIAEIFTGLYPPLIYYCTKLVPTTIFLFFLALLVYQLIKSKDGFFLYYILVGIITGITILCDPIAFVIYPAIFLWFLVTKKINFFKMILVFIVSLLTLAPWTVRNYHIHKKIIPVTTQFAVNLWIGNNPNATGTDYYRITSIEKKDYILMTHTLPLNIQDSLSRISEVERANFYLNEALKFIRKEPLKFISLLFKKIYYYFWFAPSDIYTSKDLAKFRLLFYVLYFPVLITGLIGIFFSIKNHKEVLLLLLIIFFISGLYVFTHVGLVRYRLPVELYFLMFGAYFISRIKK